MRRYKVILASLRLPANDNVSLILARCDMHPDDIADPPANLSP
jgi:hypothetical protein